MKTSLAAYLGSIAVLVCSGAVAEVNSDAIDTETLDKLKVIETINVTSSKEINDSGNDKVDTEVLKILKAADQDSDAKSKATSEKLQIIETINVTSPKEIDEADDIHVDAEVERVLKEAQGADDDSESDAKAQTLTRLEKVYAKKFKRDNDKAELIESASGDEGKPAKLAESQLVLKTYKLDSLTKNKELKQSDETEETKAAK